MNKTEFLNILDGLKSIYRKDKFPDMTQFAMEMWYESLKDLDYKITKQSIVNYIKVGKYPPTVADIREQYGLIKSKSNEQLREIEHIFCEMKNYYPNGNYDKQAEDIFYNHMCEIDNDNRISYAKAICNTVIDYVKRCEQGIEELDKTFLECIEWAVKR